MDKATITSYARVTSVSQSDRSPYRREFAHPQQAIIWDLLGSDESLGIPVIVTEVSRRMTKSRNLVPQVSHRGLTARNVAILMIIVKLNRRGDRLSTRLWVPLYDDASLVS